MTFAELQAKMSNQEFELWMALASIRSEECPSCGRKANEMSDWITVKAKCPICDYEYNRMKAVE